MSVAPVNDAPVAGRDSLMVDEGGVLSVDSPALLANDTDAENDALTIVAVGDPVNGMVFLDGTTIIYEHDDSDTLTGSFSYTVSDGVAADSITVEITVTPIDDAPPCHRRGSHYFRLQLLRQKRRTTPPLPPTRKQRIPLLPPMRTPCLLPRTPPPLSPAGDSGLNTVLLVVTNRCGSRNIHNSHRHSSPGAAAVLSHHPRPICSSHLPDWLPFGYNGNDPSWLLSIFVTRS